MRKNATPVDVGDDDHRAIDRLGKTHVGDIAVAQIDLRRRPRPLDHHALILRRQPRPGFQHRPHRPRLVLVVSLGIEVEGHLAVDDNLRLPVRRRLEQHRIEIGMWRQTTSHLQQSLRPPDLAPIHRHGRIQRHVLRLERRHPHATAVQDAAKCGDQRRFAGVGGGALDH